MSILDSLWASTSLALLGMAICLAGVFGLLTASRTRLPASLWAFLLIGSFGVSIYLHSFLDSSIAVSCLPFGLFWVTFGLIRTAYVQQLSWLLASRSVKGTLLLAVGGYLMFHSLQQTELKPDEVWQKTILEQGVRAELVENETVHAKTDQGRNIPIYETHSDVDVAELFARETDILNQRNFAFHLIQTAPPSSGSNCHGWVFAADAGHVLGAEVDAILADNLYETVSQPRPGDIVIYRNDQQTVTHSGIVRYTDGQGLVLIESKWGVLGRFLHPVDISLYGANHAFYHSPRLEATLTGVHPTHEQVSTRFGFR